MSRSLSTKKVGVLKQDLVNICRLTLFNDLKIALRSRYNMQLFINGKKAFVFLCRHSNQAFGKFLPRAVTRLNRRHIVRGTQQWAVLTGLAVLVLLWLTIHLLFAQRVAFDQQGAVQSGFNITRGLEESTLRSFAEVDKVLLYERRAIEERQGSLDLQDLFTNIKAMSDIVVQMAFIDARGMMRFSTASKGATAPLDLSDREHFKVHVNSNADTLFISAPIIGRVSKRWSIQFTRRVLDKAGNFGGVLVASLDAMHLNNFYSSLELGSSGSISLIGMDGRVRAASEAAGQKHYAIGDLITGDRLLLEANARSEGHYFVPSTEQEQGRLISFRRIKGQPLIVALRLEQRQIEQVAYQELSRNAIIGIFVSVLILSFSVSGSNHQLKLKLAHLITRRSQKHALRTSEALRATLDNMVQGIISVKSNGVIQFINERCLDLLGLDRTDIRNNATFKDLVDHLTAKGEYQTGIVTDSEQTEEYASARDTAQFSPSFVRTRTNGTVLEVKTTSSADGGFIRTITDVTKHERAREQINRLSAKAEFERAQFKTAVNKMPLGLIMFDTEHKVTICNDRYREIYGLTIEETALGTSLSEMLLCRARVGTIEVLQSDNAIDRLIEIAKANQEHSWNSRLGDGRLINVRHNPLADGGWVSVHEDITVRRLAEEKIEHMAEHDPLTNLANRTKLMSDLNNCQQVLANGEQFAVLLLDLDHFKAINDTLGHPIGDKLLIEASKRLLATSRSNDLVARLGGDEFAIIERNIVGPAAAEALAVRLMASLGQPYLIEGHQIVVGASIGIACASHDYNTAETLLQAADIALYQAKHDGRNGFRFFEQSMIEEVRERRSTEEELRQGIADRQLEVHYQPIVNTRSLAIEGYEGLVRWRHPQKGLVPPIKFIPLAESTGLIQAIGNLVLHDACRQMMEGPDDLYISVNVSPVELKQHNFVDLIREALELTGLHATRLQLEVTEGVLLQSEAGTLERLRDLRRMGVLIAMDDFGTGYSSLSSLRTFPFDKIKIDRSLIQGVSDSPANMAILKAVVDLADGLGMSLTAEGIETAEQLAIVRDLGCQQAQGYYLGRPLPATALTQVKAA